MRRSPPLTALLLLAAVGAWACATPSAPQRPAAARAPHVAVDPARLAGSQEAACATLPPKAVRDPTVGAQQAGMLPEDFEALRRAIAARGVAVTFRDSNPACAPHLAAGVQSKGHDMLTKTWDASNLKAEDAHLAGLVSPLRKKPPKGVKVESPTLALHEGEPVTCDYDMMDQVGPGGRRIPGESADDLALRAALNAALPPTPRGHRDRVMHGAQAAYPQYAALHPEEELIDVLLRPEAPLTAFDADGAVYRLETVEDALNFYRCKGAGVPPEWDVEAER